MSTTAAPERSTKATLAGALALALLFAAHPLAAQSRGPEEALLDSLRQATIDHVRADLVAAATERGVAQPGGLVFVERTRRDEPARVRKLEGNLPDSVVAAALPRIQERMAEWPTDSARMLVRLDEDGFRPGRDRDVPEEHPEMRNRRDIARALSRVPRPADAGDRTYTTNVRAVVSRSGAVLMAEAIRSSGDAEMDRAAVEVVRIMRFRPARVGGKPVDVWLTLPVTWGPD